ncbi:hypothetical protein SAMN06264348_102468 [Oceanospirillum linum]|nr:hypothetical protein SAMN04489856_10372 [Oleiphilus messinensis]SMP13496.1 hypothetical protein SAMN06264348_102468 [Oceanospirillum linum]
MVPVNKTLPEVLKRRQWGPLFRRFLLSTVLMILMAGCSGTTAYFFYPQSIWLSTPEDVGLPYKNIILTAADGTRLHSWWLPAQGSSGNTVVLYLHGNAQNISTHSHSIYWLTQEGVDVLALDYRGFGASQGETSLPDVFQDIEAATRWVKYHYPEKRFFILGQSIGASLAVNFVAKAEGFYEIDGLVLDAPFEGFGTIAREVTRKNFMAWLIYPFTIFVPGRWDPVDLAESISVPTLVMHSKDDQVIPYSHGRSVFKALAAGKKRTVCWLESRGGHIASFNYDAIRSATLRFMIEGKCTE